MTLTKELLEKTYSIDEFMRLPDTDEDTGVHFELVHGRVVEVPLAGDEHGRLGMNIILALGAYAVQNDLGQLYPPDTIFIINKDKRILRAPDVGFLANANLPDSNVGAVPVPPDLAVEIMSPHDYDHRSEFREKIRQYQEAGVQLIWVVSPREKTVEVYRPAFAAPVAELNESDSVSGEEIVPGFTLQVSAIFKVRK